MAQKTEAKQKKDKHSAPRRTFRSFFKDVLRWSSEGSPAIYEVIDAMLGLAGPVAFGVLSGRLQIAMGMSIGWLAMSGGGHSGPLRQQMIDLAYTLAAGSAAMFIGNTIADRGVATSFYVPMIAAAAGLLGGFSMPMAHASAKFILFMIIATSLGDQGTHPVAMMLLFCLGAVWSAGLSWVLRPLFHALPGCHAH